MKTFRNLTLLSGLLCSILADRPAWGATTIVSDLYNITGSGSGFGLNAGINSGINPPTTRLTGTAASGLRYFNTGTKATTAYTITTSKAKISSAVNPGRFVLSANGTSAFDYASALGISAATPANPVVYDVSISMDNDSAGTQRASFALGTAEGDAFTWDFGFQVYRAASGNNFYTIGKRIDTQASGLAADLNEAILTMGASTYGTEITILMRVTDAGSESSTYNSRVQLSLNGGSTWFYDTDTDSDLTGTGWRLNGAGRILMWDIAPDAVATYDNFSLNWNSGPRIWNGAGANGNWNNATNWSGALPVNGSALIFSGATRTVNTNNIAGLTAPWVKFSSSGFNLYGNALTVSSAVTNSAGTNTVNGSVTLGGAVRVQSDPGLLALAGGVTGSGQSLTLGGAGNTTVGAIATGAGTVTKDGAGTATLTGANTYSGNTTISVGTLALGAGGSIASSPTITIANGATYNVSAVSGYAVGGTQTLARNATSGTGNVNGSMTFNSGASLSFQADGTAGSVGTLGVTGGLTLNSTVLKVNVTGSALGAGIYSLMTYTGTKTGSFNATPVITGSGVGSGLLAQIQESAGQVNLRVYPPASTWTGAGANDNWSTAANWGGVTPISGEKLIFNGVTRQNNNNDLSGLTVPWVTFNNGGFSLNGNSLNVSDSITNLAGNNSVTLPLNWTSTAAKNWSIASGSVLLLANATTIGVTGDHSVVGGGTLRLTGTMTLTANPVFAVNEGKHIIDGGTLDTVGGYRIGSLATGSGAQTILTNGAVLTITAAGGNLRVGDSANATASRLDIDNSTLTLSGGVLLAVPYAASAIGTVNQTGGTVSPGILSFNEAGAGTGSYTIKNGTLIARQIRENTPAGSATISFDNAILRTDSSANSAFMTGLNTAQIQSGGLTIDATTLDITIGQALSGTGALNKTGANKVTLTGANTYSGNTTISAGILALGVGGSIASPTITVVTGTTLDVSAITYALGGSQTLARSSSVGAANINGSVALNSGAKFSLIANGSSASIGTFSITGNLNLNANTIAISVGGAALGVGTYPLISYTGTKTGSFNVNPTITGLGLQPGLSAKISETSGQISLVVAPGGHGVPAASIKVVENDLANTANSVTVTTTLSINGLQVRDGSSRGDYTVQVGSSGADDLTNGVLITSVAENGKDQGEDSGINYCTSALSFNSGGYFIPTCMAPAGSEYNINVSAAYFSYARWLGGYARNSAGTAGGANNLLTASPSLTLGTHFVDNGGGISTVDLTAFGIDSQTDGVLLVTGGGNNNDYASSKANTNGTWTIYLSDNGTNGGATTQGPVAFAYIPKTELSVISGKFQGDGTILMYSGTSPKFSVTNTSTGVWQLSIPGYSPSSGVLVISPEGGQPFNQDNIVSAQPSGSNWLIQSRDLPGCSLQTPPEGVVSFVFIPAPTATLVGPANNGSVSSAPTLNITANSATSSNLTVTFTGHRLAVPGPGPDFLIPVLPDTQNYARESAGSGDATKEMWFAQTDWIVANRASENIPFVATLGDCVNNADQLFQWRNATNAMYRLEKQSTTQLLEGIPYGITVGNHDQDPNGDENGDTSYYNQFFGSSHFAGKSYYGGHYDTNNDSWYDTFSAGGLDFLVISFEYGRYGATIMDWARDTMAAHPTCRTIVLTHFAGQDVADVNATTCPFGAQGQAIYTGMRTNANFFLMMSGHVFDQGGEGRRTDTFSGHSVRTLVSDYQGRFNGGNGLMRLMYFSPSNNTVSVKTYSPYTGNYETDANSQFSFSYNMQPNGAGSAGTAYANLKTNVNVPRGTQSSFVWSGLTASRTYEWYVTVTDENGDYATSAEWKFNTTSSYSGLMAAADANSNGLPDDWESSNKVKDPEADQDGDGQNNYAEYIAHTNPNDAKSLLQILDAKPGADGHFSLTWSSVGGTRYRIQYADTLDGVYTDIERDAASERDASAIGASATQSFTDILAPTNAVRFYRIKVVQEN